MSKFLKLLFIGLLILAQTSCETVRKESAGEQYKVLTGILIFSDSMEPSKRALVSLVDYGAGYSGFGPFQKFVGLIGEDQTDSDGRFQVRYLASMDVSKKWLRIIAHKEFDAQTRGYPETAHEILKVKEDGASYFITARKYPVMKLHSQQK